MTFPQIRHRRLAGSKGFLDPGLLLPGSAETPAASPLLLDTYPGAVAAYSLRKLRTAYSGAAIRVRRSSDNSEEDIGFDANGDLDTAALLAHCGVGDGFVARVYDQSSNSHHFSQASATRQPKIVNSGSVLLVGERPSLLFDGADDLLSPSATGIITSMGAYCVVNILAFVSSSGADYGGITSTYTGDVRIFVPEYDTTNFGFFSGAFSEFGTTQADTEPHVFAINKIGTGADQTVGYIDGDQVGTRTDATTGASDAEAIGAVGSGVGSFHANHYWLESIVFDSAVADTAGFFSDLTAEYGIT